MNMIVNELLSRTNAGVYVSLDELGRPTILHQHKRGIADVLGTAILLQHHLCEISAPEPPPEKVDEPAYDESKPEQNLELAATESLIRVLYQQQQPWALGMMMTLPKATGGRYVYINKWHGEPYTCGGLTSYAMHRLTRHVEGELSPKPAILARVILEMIRDDNPDTVWNLGMARVLEAMTLRQSLARV